LDSDVSLIDNLPRWIAEPGNCNANESSRREELRQASYRSHIRKLQGNQLGLSCHVTQTFQIANVKTCRFLLGETAVAAEWRDQLE
jgi:hypothetical protein